MGHGEAQARRSRTAQGNIVADIEPDKRDIAGVLADEPRPREDRVQLVLDDVVDDGRPLRGRLMAWVPRRSDLVPGDRVALRGALEAPPPIEGFDYPAYLARQGIGWWRARSRWRASATRGAVHLPTASPRCAMRSPRARPPGAGARGRIRRRHPARLRTGIDPSIGDAFARAGLTHVVAISGWNIAIVAALAAALLDRSADAPAGAGGERCDRRGGGGYVILVGAARPWCAPRSWPPRCWWRASVARADMLPPRSRSPCCVMLLAAPALLWDVGFQLSALATAGLLAFAEPVDAALGRLPRLVREPVALTSARSSPRCRSSLPASSGCHWWRRWRTSSSFRSSRS